MDVLGAWLRGLQTRGKGPASWFMVLVSEQMYHASMQGASMGVIRVHTHADSATFPDTPVPFCAHSIHSGLVFNWFICSLLTIIFLSAMHVGHVLCKPVGFYICVQS